MCNIKKINHNPKIYFVITIDTEADHSLDWKKSNPLTFRSITESIPAMLQPLFEKYRAIGTYLLTVEVLENDKAVQVMRGIEQCELGTHLHADYVEPEKKFFEYAGTYSSTFTHDYDPGIEREKISNITKLFQRKIGYRPIVYRGGKFGFSSNTALSLLNLGYSVDTSVTPKVSWKKIGGPDFRKFPEQPYFIKNIDGSSHLLEVPITVMFLSSISRILNRPTWLRPSYSSIGKIKKLIDKCITVYSYKNIIVLNMMFHSMEFFPGGSPYSKSQEDCQRLIHILEFAIRYGNEIGTEFCKLSQVRTLMNNLKEEK